MIASRNGNIIRIRPGSGWYDIDWKEFWRSRELLLLLVKRDISVVYKQTVLGPLWFLLQPVLMALVFSVVFGRVAKIPTDGLPRILFYLSGLMIWNYFRGTLDGAGNAFIHAQSLFSKVYFSRLVVPVSFPISHLVYLGWNFMVFMGFYTINVLRGVDVRPTVWVVFLPVLVAYVGLSALSFGLVMSAMTTKYRDLRFAMPFILQVWMYASPVIYSMRNVTTPWIRTALCLNPLTFALESLRHMFFGTGCISWETAAGGLAVTLVFLVIGLGAFNHVQRTFVDTI